MGCYAWLMADDRTQTNSQKSEQACRLIYDGNCRLCVSTKHKLEQAGVGLVGSDVQFLPYQSDEARLLLGERYRHGRPDMAFLVHPSGDISSGLDAFVPFIPNMRGGRFLSWILKFTAVKSLAVWCYRLIARHRYRLFGETPTSNTSG